MKSIQTLFAALFLSLLGAAAYSQSSGVIPGSKRSNCWHNTQDSSDIIKLSPNKGNVTPDDGTNRTNVDYVKGKGQGGAIVRSESYNDTTGDTPNQMPANGSDIQWSHYQPSADGNMVTVTSFTRAFNNDGTYSDSMSGCPKHYKNDPKCPKKLKKKTLGGN